MLLNQRSARQKDITVLSGLCGVHCAPCDVACVLLSIFTAASLHAAPELEQMERQDSVTDVAMQVLQVFCVVSRSLQGPACRAQVAHEELDRRAGAADAECARLGRQLQQQGGLVDAVETELTALRGAVSTAAQQAGQLQEALNNYQKRTHDAAARQDKLLSAYRCTVRCSPVLVMVKGFKVN